MALKVSLYVLEKCIQYLDSYHSKAPNLNQLRIVRARESDRSGLEWQRLGLFRLRLLGHTEIAAGPHPCKPMLCRCWGWVG